MPREKATCEARTIGQVAKRWGIGVDRVRSLVASGQLPGAFTIPSSGRYAATVKIPLASIVQAECDWSVTPQLDGGPPRKRRGRQGCSPTLTHFPELNDPTAATAGCKEDVDERPEERPP